MGTLHVGGILMGHLASVVGEITFPGRSPWPWFVIVWADGTKEPAFEDYGPAWYTVRELDAGHLDHHGPSVLLEERRGVFGGVSQRWGPGPPVVFDFAWLPRDEAASMWQVLGLRDADF
ncbi:hypothetical protein [Luteimicrobium subarcticum]|uniref:hypothetical protein n=1 Tax=Luteimicrobium subarcticum TaxID=620910 RepID=UPI0012FD3705|nr:hypothetical protein [Luteimicrobium subarcticum]